ncbi:MAG: rod shape-determining protein MreC [Chitinophagaceae bacterium]|nr:MAG: rod shape-determining protein MreC [Chitinophagaceae bacterium]
MRNIFRFIRRFSVLLAFLVLQALALWTLYRYNHFHRAKGLAAANEVTGFFNSQYNTFEDFFRMKEENRRLLRMNDSLMNLQPSNFLAYDSTARYIRDSVRYDTSGKYRLYAWRDAQVVRSTVNSDRNYVQINRGANQGIKDDMGVFSSNGGLVGKVINVSANYSQVMSLINVQNRVNVIVKKSQSSGNLTWDGANPRLLVLSNIPKSDSLVIGDTILTGKFSLSYPSGHMVGTVAEIVPDNSTNFYVLRIKTTANFNDLQQVMVVENLEYAELDQLYKDTEKKVEEVKKPRR